MKLILGFVLLSVVLCAGQQSPNISSTQPENQDSIDCNSLAPAHKLNPDIVALIMNRRSELKLTQAELAKRINEVPKVINQIESCTAIRDNKILRKLEDVLGVRLIGQDMGAKIERRTGKRSSSGVTIAIIVFAALFIGVILCLAMSGGNHRGMTTSRMGQARHGKEGEAKRQCDASTKSFTTTP